MLNNTILVESGRKITHSFLIHKTFCEKNAVFRRGNLFFPLATGNMVTSSSSSREREGGAGS